MQSSFRSRTGRRPTFVPGAFAPSINISTTTRSVLFSQRQVISSCVSSRPCWSALRKLSMKRKKGSPAVRWWPLNGCFQQKFLRSSSFGRNFGGIRLLHQARFLAGSRILMDDALLSEFVELFHGIDDFLRSIARLASHIHSKFCLSCMFVIVCRPCLGLADVLDGSSLDWHKNLLCLFGTYHVYSTLFSRDVNAVSYT